MGKQHNKLDESTLAFATISELNAALRNREISVRELVKFFGRRLETIGPEYNALACSLLKRDKNDPKDLDDEFKRYRFRGPLQDIPYGVKDLIAVAGVHTPWG